MEKKAAPVFKKGYEQLLKNYCPTSLFLITGKILERLLCLSFLLETN